MRKRIELISEDQSEAAALMRVVNIVFRRSPNNKKRSEAQEPADLSFNLKLFFRNVSQSIFNFSAVANPILLKNTI